MSEHDAAVLEQLSRIAAYLESNEDREIVRSAARALKRAAHHKAEADTLREQLKTAKAEGLEEAGKLETQPGRVSKYGVSKVALVAYRSGWMNGQAEMRAIIKARADEVRGEQG